MRFVVWMMVREVRASWWRLGLFFLCVALGVGGIAAIRSLVQNVREALVAEARTLTAADVYLRTDRPWTDAVRSAVARRTAALAGVARTETIDTATMARQVGAADPLAAVVELRGVQPEFPFYGQVGLASGRPYVFEMLREQGAVVAPELLVRLDLDVGDPIAIGEMEFTIRDVLTSEAGRSLGAFSFGPRVLAAYDAVHATGVVTPTSRATRQMLLRVGGGDIDRLVDALQEDLQGAFVRVGSYRRTENRIARHLERAEHYLGLIGFVVVLLGGIGIWSVMRVFVQQRLVSVAALRCLGATTRQVLSVYLLQACVLSAAGSLFGIPLAQAALELVPDALVAQAAAAAGVSGDVTVLTASAVREGLLVGVLMGLVFAVVPLLELRHTAPLLLLRQGLVAAPRGVDWLRTGVAGVGIVAVVLVAGWQASSLEVGAYVVAGFAAVAAVLHGLGRGLVRAIRPVLLTTGWFPLRHAALYVTRRGHQTRVIMLAVGLGVFVIVMVHSLQTGLIRSFSFELRDDAPDMFLLDIQDDQRTGVQAVVAEAGGGEFDPIPVLRARVTAVEGERLRFGTPRAAQRNGLGREYTVTYRSVLEENERVVAGTFWPAGPTRRAEVSIEESLYRDRGLQVGDRMTFDVMGRSVEARVTSVRSVAWDDTRSGGFMFVFRPGSFAGAPHSYIALLEGPSDPVARAALQRDVSARYANVSVIDGLAVLRTVRRVLDYAARAIGFVGGLAFVSGGLVLLGSVALTKIQRGHQAAVFRTLGADSRQLALMLAMEYGVIGAVAGAAGSVGSIALSWVLARQVFDMAWDPDPMVHVLAVVVTAAGVAAVGVVSSLDILRRKPLELLRAE